jgi:phosphate starvation-inducible membrane PsiE
METTNKSNSINLGLYLGATLAAIVVLIYAIDLDLMVEWWLSVALLTVVIAFGVVAAKRAKKNNVGLLSFKEAFVNYFLTIAVGTAISAVVGIVIFNVVDPEAAAHLNEQILLKSKQMMEGFGMPQEAMATALDEASKKDNFSIGSQLQSYVFSLALYAIIGLIVALIVKKTNTSEA